MIKLHSHNLPEREHARSASRGLAVQIGVEVPTEAGTRVIKAQLLVDAVDLLHVFGIQLEVALQVVLDAAVGFALR